MAKPRRAESAAARARSIVLGHAASAPSAELLRRQPPAPHWRRWSLGGMALAALLHGLLLVASTVSLPAPSPARREAERPIPVEIVKREPEKEPEKKKPEDPKADAKKDKDEKEEARKKAEEEKRKADEAAKAAAKPASPPPPAKSSPLPPPARTPPASAPPPPERPASPNLALPPRPPPRAMAEAMPRRPAPNPEPPPAPRRGPNGGQVVPADEDAVPPPGDRKVVAFWVAEPLTVDLNNRCGLARVTAVMSLTERLGENHYRGTLRNHIVWARCPPTATLYRVELRISGSAAVMTGDGFTDRGVIRGNTMMLEDAYGRSIWKKR